MNPLRQWNQRVNVLVKLRFRHEESVSCRVCQIVITRYFWTGLGHIGLSFPPDWLALIHALRRSCHPPPPGLVGRIPRKISQKIIPGVPLPRALCSGGLRPIESQKSESQGTLAWPEVLHAEDPCGVGPGTTNGWEVTSSGWYLLFAMSPLTVNPFLPAATGS
jgi:hypothetical protein